MIAANGCAGDELCAKLQVRFKKDDTEPVGPAHSWQSFSATRGAKRPWPRRRGPSRLPRPAQPSPSARPGWRRLASARRPRTRTSPSASASTRFSTAWTRTAHRPAGPRRRQLPRVGLRGRPGATYPSLPPFAGLGAPFEDAGSYSVNLSLAPAGVIRPVPAHRPLPGAVPPLPSALPAMPSVPTVPSLGGLNFPWMESSRRFVKDRFTGEQGVQNRRRAPAPGARGAVRPTCSTPEKISEAWRGGGLSTQGPATTDGRKIREFGENKPVLGEEGASSKRLGAAGDAAEPTEIAQYSAPPPGGTGSAWGLKGSQAGLGFQSRVSPQRRRRSRPSP